MPLMMYHGNGRVSCTISGLVVTSITFLYAVLVSVCAYCMLNVGDNSAIYPSWSEFHDRPVARVRQTHVA